MNIYDYGLWYRISYCYYSDRAIGALEHVYTKDKKFREDEINKRKMKSIGYTHYAYRVRQNGVWTSGSWIQPIE